MPFDDLSDYPEGDWAKVMDSGLQPGATTDEVADVGLYAIAALPKDAVLLFDAATNVQWPQPILHALNRLTKDNETVDAPHLRNLATWIERYGYGCISPTGEYFAAVSVGSILSFVNSRCTNATMLSDFDAYQDIVVDAWPVVQIRSKRRTCTENLVAYVDRLHDITSCRVRPRSLCLLYCSMCSECPESSFWVLVRVV